MAAGICGTDSSCSAAMRGSRASRATSSSASSKRRPPAIRNGSGVASPGRLPSAADSVPGAARRVADTATSVPSSASGAATAPSPNTVSSVGEPARGPRFARRSDGGVRRADRRSLPCPRTGGDRTRNARCRRRRGRLGLLVAQVLRAHEARLTVVVRSETSRSSASALGFETADVDSRPRRLPAGSTSSSTPPVSRPASLGQVRWSGPGAPLSSSQRFMVRRRCLFRRWWSTRSPCRPRCGPFPRAIELLAGGRVEVKPLVAAIYPLESLPRRSTARNGLKVILTTLNP